LSHCWGGAQVYTLNPETKHEMIKAVPMEKLAKNFQDAIHVTRELGYSYIWIDSLCIIQNQQRKPEWEAESAKDWTEQSRIMGDVYRNSDLTIAATSAANPHVGFINLKGHPNDTNTSQNGVEDSPLCQRAWVFQERLLSPRMLHFTNSMLFWECRTMTASEIDPSGHPRDRRVGEPIAPEKNKEDAFLFHRRWYDLVKVYSAGKLTFQKDKLMAISSIVREIQERHPANGYVDGLWEETLLMDLLWRVDVKGDALAMGRLKENELPSWTWASTD
ncbi:heterokaryon incompatibility protein-domain-containing protein, partial [Lasiosphaeris hirsuta]